MNTTDIVRLTVHALWLSFKLSLPVVIATSVVGVLVSLIQAVTHVQDQTLPFLVKLTVAVAVLFFSGYWMFGELENILDASFDILSRRP